MQLKTSLLPLTFVMISLIAITSGYVSDEQPIQYEFGKSSRHHIVKRKGGKGGGRSRGSSKSKGRTSSQSNPNYPYPRQPGSNPSNPAGSYPKQPAYNPNYNPGQAGAGYPGQTGYGTGHGQGMGGIGKGMGTGILGGAAAGSVLGGGKGIGHGIGKGGMGGMLGGAALGGIGGAVLGSVAGYKLGKAVGSLGRHGYYGYYDDHRRYIRCDPPTRVEYHPETNETYIPREIHYDQRCQYYDYDPMTRGYGGGYGYRVRANAVTEKLDWICLAALIVMWLA